MDFSASLNKVKDPQTTKDDRLRHSYIRKNGAPSPVWSRSLACGNTIRELLPPIVSTFTRSEPRGSERLSAPEPHRYGRVLDWKVAHEREKSTSAGARLYLQA